MQRIVAVVDDNVDNMKLFRAVLTRQDYLVLEFDTGVGLARSLADSEVRPDLVLLDIQLPDRDGFEVLAEIRSLRPDLRVVALTAYASDHDRERALAAGFDGYLTKPIDIARFPRQVAAAIAGDSPSE